MATPILSENSEPVLYPVIKGCLPKKSPMTVWKKLKR